jgi:GH15 family glucan-1,4-alpha-glucosidase
MCNIKNKIEFHIYDAEGRFYKKIFLKNADKVIDASQWAKGIYVIRATVSGKEFSSKIEIP